MTRPVKAILIGAGVAFVVGVIVSAACLVLLALLGSQW